MSLDVHELRAALHQLPADERCALLLLSCVEMDQHALAAVLNVIGVGRVMAERLGPYDRRTIDEQMRKHIARLERRPREYCHDVIVQFPVRKAAVTAN